MPRNGSRNPYPFHTGNGPTMYTGEHVAAMMRAREAREARERRAKSRERIAMLATIAGVVAVICFMFHQLTN